MVAVKVIEHNECVASKLDGLRESVLSASIQHPNVVCARPSPPLCLSSLQYCTRYEVCAAADKDWRRGVC